MVGRSRKLHLLPHADGLLRTVHSHTTQHHQDRTSQLYFEQRLLMAFNHPHSHRNQWRFHQPQHAPGRVRHHHLSAEMVCSSLWHFFSLCQIPFSSSSVTSRSFYYHYLIYPFSDHLQSEKVRSASSPLIEKFIFLLDKASQASCVQHRPSHLWKHLGLFIFATWRDK